MNVSPASGMTACPDKSVVPVMPLLVKRIFKI